MDAEKLISWGSTATIIKRYGLEEHTLWSAWFSVCVWAVYSTGGEFVLSCLAVFVCVLESQTEVDC